MEIIEDKGIFHVKENDQLLKCYAGNKRVIAAFSSEKEANEAIRHFYRYKEYPRLGYKFG